MTVSELRRKRNVFNGDGSQCAGALCAHAITDVISSQSVFGCHREDTLFVSLAQRSPLFRVTALTVRLSLKESFALCGPLCAVVLGIGLTE